jgi:hypothetical protein
MNPYDPESAQQIVVEYARVLERDIAENRHPARIDSLPYAASVIKTAIHTSIAELARTGRLTQELRDYFETAYTSLAEYLDGELVKLITQYRDSAEQLAAEAVSTQQRTTSAAWRTVKESGTLAGEIARATTVEAEKLRGEYQDLLRSV